VARAGGIESLTELREAVRRKATGSSLRQTATDIGMSWSGLRTFLNGTTPHPATVKKISDWYLRQAMATKADNMLTVEMALSVLAEHIAPSSRRIFKRAVLDLMSELPKRDLIAQTSKRKRT
jgi:hypothetical protein